MKSATHTGEKGGERGEADLARESTKDARVPECSDVECELVVTRGSSKEKEDQKRCREGKRREAP